MGGCGMMRVICLLVLICGFKWTTCTDFPDDVSSMLDEEPPASAAAAVVKPACESKEAIKCAGCKGLLTGKLPDGLTTQFCISVCPKYISCVKKSTIEKYTVKAKKSGMMDKLR